MGGGELMDLTDEEFRNTIKNNKTDQEENTKPRQENSSIEKIGRRNKYERRNFYGTIV